ncbi:helix-turn-helix domain-containing protein [Thalassomonas haliotis]|uniref:Helix-turn-helix transcriptional regulator n=1 Tax=Thalassomonas haliotis TaxID=485448 RepID=A0ABY7VF83_9GAMM|nr:helix-turn-helix transcriptional regulator [Thalassomonas haliotis]WDE12344.1 helix-turn-helix transcriptional regulator [Thalassomonas haliotis]
MKRIEQTKKLLGNLIKKTRATTMDQEELALRSGTSTNTISRLERGKGVNTDTLLSVLNQLDLLDPILTVIEEQYELVDKNPLRKTSKQALELPNDF